MYLVGFIKTEQPKALINPVMCKNEKDLYTWLANFLNETDFSLDKPLTEESVYQSLQHKSPVLIPMSGYRVALMFGEDSIIQDNTERFIHNLSFRLPEYKINL